ncbi:MAG: damage-inducible protein DinB [Abitibacteriaceae bacterium]|nr:damage-inducible protein DinB [Abditibacteriaceae bacterium]MBV9868024.1 damage-inducible protein DinB [Abditibacteriaceae bacterium]
MQNLNYFKTMCQYNEWMNEKLYTVCNTIPDEVRKRDLGAFFHSMHGTLNHLLLADRLWLGRFTGKPFAASSLDQELYSDFAELWRERRITDAHMREWLDTLSDSDLTATFRFTSMVNPTEREFPFWFCLMHCFNHQTHHRGQLTTLLEQTGYDSGVTDLLMMNKPEL